MTRSQKSLSSLVVHVPGVVQVSGPDAPVTGLRYDSRQVQPGDIFFALAGGNLDGHRFIPGAIEGGAVAVVGTQPLEELPVPYIQVEDSRLALAYFSAAFYDFPGHQMLVIGVTGTDGKTTTANLIYHILLAAGYRVGMISTVNAVVGDQLLDTGFHVTTPEAPDIQRYLNQMVQAGLNTVILETTSHGLAQQRVAGVGYDIAVVTNITHEHLDYHGSYEAYQEAKGRLFEAAARFEAKPIDVPHGAVLNLDDRSYPYLKQRLNQTLEEKSNHKDFKMITYGLDPLAQVHAAHIEHLPAGLRFEAQGRDWQAEVQAKLVGEYNVSNCLAALAASIEIIGVDPAKAEAGIAAMPGVPGRMETIDLGQDFAAIVDFAHTPNALKRALQAGREITQRTGGKLIAVFGSAGLRDRQKRRMMAETAIDLADVSVFTAEDPRTESLGAILAEMAAGAESRGGREGEHFFLIGDRREAIRFGVALAKPGDILIACGKGHEQSMCFGETEYSWDDRTAMRAALSERLGVAGPQMPFLPE